MIINLIDRVKYSFRKDKDLLSALHGILGFYPHNLEIYRIALAHKSQAYRSQKGRPLNNERLEFLGDAILEAIVSDIVFHRYERKREGFLTSTRSKIVQRTSLNRLAAEIGLDRLIKANTQPGSHNNNIGGNAFEALVGAIYLDRGYNHCKWFIKKRIVGRLLDLDGVAQKEVNFKSKLLEWTQKNRIQSEFQMDQTAGKEPGEIIFGSIIFIEGLKAGEGKGHTKKESQQMAAKAALTKLRREPRFLESIFKAKEKRTAMEAPEICALPKIEEIEAELTEKQAITASTRSREARSAAARSAKRAPQRPAPSPQQDLKKQKPISQQLKAPKINLPAEEATTPDARTAPTVQKKQGRNHKTDNTAKNQPTASPSTPAVMPQEQDLRPAKPTTSEEIAEKSQKKSSSDAYDEDRLSQRQRASRGTRAKRAPNKHAGDGSQQDDKKETSTATPQREALASGDYFAPDEKGNGKEACGPRQRRKEHENPASEGGLRAERERREAIVRQAEAAAYEE